MQKRMRKQKEANCRMLESRGRKCYNRTICKKLLEIDICELKDRKGRKFEYTEYVIDSVMTAGAVGTRMRTI